eukprot:TRINITY_DN1887_c0_g1_i1.p1 TRINITY_DN1887_c0_g1~~TRINITY_DN1887_c0_g1_i1.p1  ORF type:complete len:272 (+),score=59.39 TRINITY_DN1887_c0_g1_i1:65-880(+)
MQGILKKADPSFWVKDEHVSHCEGCNSLFDSVNRRHHCRFCGHVFCTNCSVYKLVNPAFDLNGDRGCNLCHQFLNTDLKYLQNPQNFVRYTMMGKQNVTISLSFDYMSLVVQVLSSSAGESDSLLANRMRGGDNLNLGQYQRLTDGQQTEVFRKTPGSSGGGGGGGLFALCGFGGGEDLSINSDKCFSLIFSGNQTVDLEATSGDRKREWISKWSIFEKRMKSDSWKYYIGLVGSKLDQERERDEMQKQKKKQESREKAQNMRDKYNLRKN